MSKQILIHGNDATLLETRRLILAENGFSVQTALDSSVLLGLLDSTQPDLLIACSSLDVESQMRDVIVSRRLKLRCLVITPQRQDTADIPADGVFFAFDGPERFVSEVQKQLA